MTVEEDRAEVITPAVDTAEAVSLAVGVVGICVTIAAYVVTSGSVKRRLAAVGGALLVGGLITFALLALGGSDNGFAQRVRQICDDHRALQSEANRQFADLRPQASDPGAYMASWSDVAARFAYGSRRLLNELEALDPPGGAGDAYREAVEAWRRLLRTLDGALEGARVAATPEEAAQVVNTIATDENDRVATARDAALRELGGPGCDPSLPPAAVAE